MKIYVKVLCGKVLCVRVCESRRVDSVKRQIIDMLGISTPTLSNLDGRLYRAKPDTEDLEELESNKTLSYYGIGPRITLKFGMRISVQLNVVSSSSKISIALNIHTSDSINNVKQLIWRQLGIPCEQQRLAHCGRLLEDDECVRNYNIKNDDDLFVIRRQCQFDLIIREGESESDFVVLTVKPSFTVDFVKGMITEMSGIPTNLQCLSFQGRVLNSKHTLKSYSIVRECTVTLNVYPGQLFIRGLTGKTMTLNAKMTDSIDDIKTVIEQREGIPPLQQKLLFQNKQLQDGTLGEYGVKSESTLDLSLSLYGGGCMELYIKTNTGKTILVQADSSNTVLELKEIIFEQKGYPIEQQKLIFVGIVLENQRRLAYYNIQRATTLHLVISRKSDEKRLNITVLTHTGHEICITTTLNHKVESLLSAIEESEGIPKHCQQLLHRGVALNPQKLLKDCNFNNSGTPSSQHHNILLYLQLNGQAKVFVKILSSSSKNSAVQSFEKKIVVSINEEMKVSALKKIIEFREKIPIYFQTLLFSGKVLDDDHLLEQHFITNNCVLHLWPERLHHSSHVKITVKTPSNSLDLSALSPTTSICDVKLKSLCLRKGNFSMEQFRLYYDNLLLSNNRSLCEYTITSSSKLYLIPPEEFPVCVHDTMSNNQYIVSVQETDTITRLKNKLYGTAKIPVHNDLYLSSILLEDGKALEHYRISAACKLYSVCPGEIPISIKTRLSTSHLAVDPLEAVSTIAEKISQCSEIGVEPSKQRLILRNTPISEEDLQLKNFKELGILPGNTLTLIVVPEEIDIYINTPRGTTLMLVCLNDATIHNIKEAIEQNEDIPLENQILPFTEDDKSLREYNVLPGTHLDVGHLSVTPLKAAIDQQELCERVVIQEHNRQLKQELEFTRRDGHAMKDALESTGHFYEMLLDSASNYMDTKITTFEENLAQSREVIGRLQKENRELKRKLEKKTEKMNYLETKLSSDSFDSKIEDSLSQDDFTTSASEKNNSQIMFTCIPEGKENDEEENCDGEIQRPTCSTPQPALQLGSHTFGFYREFTYTGSKSIFSCKEYGIKISFPEQRLERDIIVSVMSLNVSDDDCTIDCEEDAEFVSAVYRIQVSEALPSPVKVEMQHCYCSTDGDTDNSTLSFVRSETDQDYFQAIEGGHFDPNTSYGEIELCQFSEIAIARFFRVGGGMNYCASVFKIHREVTKIEVHIVITKDLANNLQYLKDDEYKQWTLIAQLDVEFGGPISYKIDNAVETSQSKHWTITIMQKPAKIVKRSVKRYYPGRRLPHIRLRVTWDSDDCVPIRDDLTLTLTGAKDPDTKDPVSFVIECAPVAAFQLSNLSSNVSCDTDVTSPLGSMRSNVSRIHFPENNIFNQRVNPKDISLIRYNDGTCEKELRTKEQILPHWRNVAEQLQFRPARIGGLSLSQTPTDDMILEWMRMEKDHTWRKLIEAINDAGLRTAAIDLKDALLFNNSEP